MIKHAFLLLTVILTLTVRAHADISNPDLLDIARDYQRSLKPVAAETTAADVLKALSEARKAGNPAAIIRWSEALVALGDQNPRSWLNLSKAWIRSDPTADSGLGAAIRAVQLAAERGDRVEALLLASASLRSRLDRDRALHEAAMAEVEDVERLLDQAEDPEMFEDFVAPDPDNPNGRIQALEKALDEANVQIASAAAGIAATVAAIDEVYREIQLALPELNVGDMQAGDQRLGFFPLADSENPHVEYKVEGNDTRSCIAFNKALKQDSREYGAMVSLALAPANEPVRSDSYDVRAEGGELCILRLEHRTAYTLTLGADLAAEDGSVLGNPVEVSILIPDLKPSIGVSDGELVLPRSGPGELPISLTNVTEFPLAIHRLVDRSLYRHLALGHIRNGIPSAEYANLLDLFSETLWTGNATRELPDKDLNASVRSFIPVGTILADRAAWLSDPDRKATISVDGVTSMAQPVRAVSDPLLSITGSFAAGTSEIDPNAAGRFVPGVYALVAPVASQGPEKEFHCADDDTCEAYAAQWFVISDIGLSFYEGERQFTVMARSLTTGEPISGASVQLIAQSNRLLAEAKTEKGIATFPRSLTAGGQSNALVAVLADTGADFNFIQYGAERLDLSRLNVGGSLDAAPAPALLYTDRGIYQPGETIRAFGVLRERTVHDPARAPAELQLEISDYKVSSRPILPADWFDGGGLLPLDIPSTAKPGSAALKLISVSGDVLAQSTLEVGRIRPDRARLEFSRGDGETLKVAIGDRNTAKIEGRVRVQYLYGTEGISSQGAAAGLRVEAVVRVRPVDAPGGGCYGGFMFGSFDDDALPTVWRDYSGYTDEQGVATLMLSRIRLPNSTKPLVATIEVTVFDASGPVTAGQIDLPIPPRQLELGMSALPRVAQMESGGYRLGLDIAPLDAAGGVDLGRELQVKVEREHDVYSWENVDGVWQHITSHPRQQVSTAALDLARSGPVVGAIGRCPGYVRLDDVVRDLGPGRYILTLTDPASKASASVRVNTGVAQTSVDDLEPNLFVLSSAKQRYAPGEKISLTVDAPFRTGKAAVAVAQDEILAWFEGDVRDGKSTISFEASRDWTGKGLYALATAFKADSGAGREMGPARAIGATYFEVSNERSDFDISIRREAPVQNDYIRPGEPLVFDVCVNAPSGACGSADAGAAYAVAFVVDEGLLSLTGHEEKFDALEEAVFGGGKMSLRMMDNYGRLLLKTGGDRPGRQALSNYTSRQIVAAAQGPVRLENGRARFTFDNKQLEAGSLKLHVVAWSASGVSSSRHTVAVRNLVVSSLGVPDFFLAGDKPILPLRLENISFANHEGDYALTFKGEGGIGVALANADGSRVETNAEGAFLVSAPATTPRDLLLSLDIPPRLAGTYKLSLDLAAVGAPQPLPPEERSRSWTLDVRAASVVAQQLLSFPLGSTPSSVAGMLEGVVSDRYEPDTVKVAARFAGAGDELRLASIDAPQEAAEPLLDEMVWLGMVYLQDPALAEDPATRARVQANIDGVQALQFVDGAFVPYRTDGDLLPSEVGFEKSDSNYAGTVRHGLLRNASALDFLLRARGAGYVVSAEAIRNSLSFVEGRMRDAVLLASQMADPTLMCAFDTRYAMLLLAQQDKVTKDDIGELESCAAEAGEAAVAGEADVFSELVTLAVMSQFGEDVDAEGTLAAHYASPGEYLGELDDYRKAIALSMLANMRVDADLVRPVAESFLDRDKALDLRTRAWLARSLADFGLAGRQRLTVADIVVSDADALPLNESPDGLVESEEVDYVELLDTSVTIAKAGQAAARGLFRISGELTDPDSAAQPATSLGRRFFLLKGGKEVKLEDQPLVVGDRLVVVVEGTAGALGQFTEQNFSDLGARYGPIMVEAPLPSAFTLAASDLKGIDLKGDLAKLEMVGNPRSVEMHPQGWRAILLPKSTEAVVAHRPPGQSSEEEAESEEGEEGEAAEGAAEGEELLVAGDEQIEFRQGFVITVSAAGSFLFPPTTVEPLDFPGNTLISRQARFAVSASGPQR